MLLFEDLSVYVAMPPAWLHSINALVHSRVGPLIHAVVWTAILLCAPLAAPLVWLGLALRVVGGLARATSRREDYGAACVFVTGCDTGFGRALALALTDPKSGPGFGKVFAGVLSEAAGADLARAGGGAGGVLHPLVVDVTNADQIAVAAGAVAEWVDAADSAAPRRLHAVVNNAGIGDSAPVDWLRHGPDGGVALFKLHMEINVYGALRVTTAFLPLLKARSTAFLML